MFNVYITKIWDELNEKPKSQKIVQIASSKGVPKSNDQNLIELENDKEFDNGEGKTIDWTGLKNLLKSYFKDSAQQRDHLLTISVMEQ
jgi:hypothetical protein